MTIPRLRLARRWSLLALLVVSPPVSGCEAVWEDLRDPAASDAGPPGMDDDGGVPQDAGSIPPDAGGDGLVVIARAMMEGRSGYGASGTAELVSVGGSLEVRFDSDFTSQGVPGPIVVLTNRPDIGRALDPGAGDLNLGVLTSSDGAQSYAAPPGAETREYVWVYCLPVGLEVARGQLVEVP